MIGILLQSIRRVKLMDGWSNSKTCFYETVNWILGLLIAGVLLCLVIFAGPNEGWPQQVGLLICFVDSVIFLWRAAWMGRCRLLSSKLTDRSEDYVLERTTLFGWISFLLLAIVGELQGFPVDRAVNSSIVGWLLALILWAPIVSIVGPSKGKLIAETPEGSTLVWPRTKPLMK